MRYLLGFLLLMIAAVPILMEGDGTFSILAATVAIVLILSKTDWTKDPEFKEGEDG